MIIDGRILVDEVEDEGQGKDEGKEEVDRRRPDSGIDELSNRVVLGRRRNSDQQATPVGLVWRNYGWMDGWQGDETRDETRRGTRE